MNIVTDTGYDSQKRSNCYYVSRRQLTVSDDTTRDEINAFIDVERKKWHGQEFNASVDGKTVTIRRAVDTGD